LDHVIVEDNYSYDNSGGIHISNSYPTISNSIIIRIILLHQNQVVLDFHQALLH
jgi:parallel beta-helix repeat protein